MADLLTASDVRRMLLYAAEHLREHEAMLSSLDAATGDGDHGAAMRKVADAVTTCVGAHADGAPLGDLLTAIGWAAMDTDAGSAGPLYGSFFLGMSAGAGSPLDAAGLVSMFEQGCEQLQGATPAKPGDKTMIDTLDAAMTAARRALETNSAVDALMAALDAGAAEGAAATKSMQARFGRAKNIGARSIGHADPGATSMSLLFAGLHKGLSHA
jgi:dihydroxyacetone kinase-like protein